MGTRWGNGAKEVVLCAAHFSVGPYLAHLVTPESDVARDLLKNINANRSRQGLPYVLSSSMGLTYKLRSANHLLLPLAAGRFNYY
jgi:hypothetical protein